MWAIAYGPDVDPVLPDHEYLIFSFEDSTFVYKFEREGQSERDNAQAISDSPSCEFETDSATVYACSMFESQGIVQVLLSSACDLSDCAGTSTAKPKL